MDLEDKNFFKPTGSLRKQESEASAFASFTPSALRRAQSHFAAPRCSEHMQPEESKIKLTGKERQL
jgi:hypothetical protein